MGNARQIFACLPRRQRGNVNLQFFRDSTSAEPQLRAKPPNALPNNIIGGQSFPYLCTLNNSQKLFLPSHYRLSND